MRNHPTFHNTRLPTPKRSNFRYAAGPCYSNTVPPHTPRTSRPDPNTPCCQSSYCQTLCRAEYSHNSTPRSRNFQNNRAPPPPPIPTSALPPIPAYNYPGTPLPTANSTFIYHPPPYLEPQLLESQDQYMPYQPLPATSTSRFANPHLPPIVPVPYDYQLPPLKTSVRVTPTSGLPGIRSVFPDEETWAERDIEQRTPVARLPKEISMREGNMDPNPTFAEVGWSGDDGFRDGGESTTSEDVSPKSKARRRVKARNLRVTV